MSIEIANESGVEVDEADLAALARYVLDGMRMHPLAELSVLLVDRATMADLHERWMGEPGPTDVLAFPMDELRPPPPGSGRGDQGGGGEPDGTRAARRRRAVPRGGRPSRPPRPGTAARRAGLLCTHGILHLLGYDHAEPAEEATMFGLQDELLGSWRAARAPGVRQAGEQPDGPG